jgi:hypothetical protein
MYINKKITVRKDPKGNWMMILSDQSFNLLSEIMRGVHHGWQKSPKHVEPYKSMWEKYQQLGS